MTRRRQQPPLDYTNGGPDRRSWHFEKRLSLDTLVAIGGIAIVVGGPVLVWGRAMESRVLALEVIQTERSKTDVARESDRRDERAQITTRLDTLNDKVTQLQIQIGQLVPISVPPVKTR